MTFLPAETYLAEHRFCFETLGHPLTRSSLQTAQKAGIPPAQLIKSLVLWNGEYYLMCLLPASRVLMLDWLDRETGYRHRLATEEEVGQLLPGCAPGAVPALGQAFDLPVLWDHCLSHLNDIYFEAGDHRHVIHMEGQEFRSLLDQDCAISLSCTPEAMDHYPHIH